MTDFVGRRFGQYEILGLLGKGGMAAVYRARQVSLNREVAIKIIQAQDEAFLSRFRREADTISKLSHPHILKVHDYGQQDQYIYLVMELLAGGSIASRIQRQGALSPAEVVPLLRQIASALDYAHSKGVVHRDIKPQNVLLDDLGNAFLTDFGIVKVLGASTTMTHTGAVIGTPAYMAPEQWRGGDVDARSDIYALGITLYEMLTGEQPFVADTPYAMMHKHIFEAPPSVQRRQHDLPAAIDSVLEQMLAKDPDARYISAGAAFAAFEAAASGKLSPKPSIPASDRPTSPAAAPWMRDSVPTPLGEEPAQPASRPGSRRGLLVLGVIGALLVVAVGLLIVISGGSTPPDANSAANATGTAIVLAPTQTVTLVEAQTPSIAPSQTVPPSATTAPTTMALPSLTATHTATMTDTATASATASPTATVTHTPPPSATATGTATRTFTPTSTLVPSATTNPVLIAGMTITARVELSATAISIQNTVKAIIAATETSLAAMISAQRMQATLTALALLPTATLTPRPPTLTPIPTITPLLLPTLTPLPTSCPPVLTVGCTARVYVEDEGLKLRSQTSTQAPIIENLPRGTVVTVLDGPQRAGGYTWWYVQTAAGNQGWCVEAADNLTTLIPLP